MAVCRPQPPPEPEMTGRMTGQPPRAVRGRLRGGGGVGRRAPFSPAITVPVEATKEMDGARSGMVEVLIDVQKLCGSADQPTGSPLLAPGCLQSTRVTPVARVECVEREEQCRLIGPFPTTTFDWSRSACQPLSRTRRAACVVPFRRAADRLMEALFWAGGRAHRDPNRHLERGAPRAGHSCSCVLLRVYKKTKPDKEKWPRRERGSSNSPGVGDVCMDGSSPPKGHVADVGAGAILPEWTLPMCSGAPRERAGRWAVRSPPRGDVARRGRVRAAPRPREAPAGGHRCHPVPRGPAGAHASRTPRSDGWGTPQTHPGR